MPHQIVLTSGYCAYLDVENTKDPSLVDSLGVNTKNILIFCVESSSEQLPSLFNSLTRNTTVDEIVVDSVCD